MRHQHSRTTIRIARALAALGSLALLGAAGNALVAISSVKMSAYSTSLPGALGGTVSIDQASPAVVGVTLSSSNPQVVSVPGSVVVPPRSTSMNFVATAVGAGCATISATQGGRTRSAMVVVHPASTSTSLSLVVPNQLLLLGGSHQSSVSSPQFKTLATVSLRSSNPAVASVPDQVTLARGTGTFAIAGKSAGCATITATYGTASTSRTVQVVYAGG